MFLLVEMAEKALEMSFKGVKRGSYPMLVCQEVSAVIYISIGRYLKNWAATDESCIILQMEYSPPSIRLMIRPIRYVSIAILNLCQQESK